MIWKSLLALVLGFFGGWWVTACAGIWYMDKANIFDRDGGGAMGTFFVIGPFGGALIAIALAAVTVARERARRERAAAGLPPEPASPGYRLWRGVVTAAATYFALWGIISFNGPYGLSDSANLALLEGLTLLAGAAAGIWNGLRRT